MGKRARACHDRLSLPLIGQENGTNVSAQQKKRRNTKPKRIRITFGTQVKTSVASVFSTEQQ